MLQYLVSHLRRDRVQDVEFFGRKYTVWTSGGKITHTACLGKWGKTEASRSPMLVKMLRHLVDLSGN